MCTKYQCEDHSDELTRAIFRLFYQHTRGIILRKHQALALDFTAKYEVTFHCLTSEFQWNVSTCIDCPHDSRGSEVKTTWIADRNTPGPASSWPLIYWGSSIIFQNRRLINTIATHTQWLLKLLQHFQKIWYFNTMAETTVLEHVHTKARLYSIHNTRFIHPEHKCIFMNIEYITRQRAVFAPYSKHLYTQHLQQNNLDKQHHIVSKNTVVLLAGISAQDLGT